MLTNLFSLENGVMILIPNGLRMGHSGASKKQWYSQASQLYDEAKGTKLWRVRSGNFQFRSWGTGGYRYANG